MTKLSTPVSQLADSYQIVCGFVENKNNPPFITSEVRDYPLWNQASEISCVVDWKAFVRHHDTSAFCDSGFSRPCRSGQYDKSISVVRVPQLLYNSSRYFR